jgi:phospholipase/carboxylesterase
LSALLDFDGLTHKAPTPSNTAVLLLHGYGASKENLFPVAEFVGHADWYLPDGPESLRFGQLEIGRAWFPLDMASFEQAALSKDYSTLTTMPFRGLAEASEKMLQQYMRLKEVYQNVILAGFSQGSVVAVDTFLKSKLPMDGLMLFSSTIMHKSEWQREILSAPKINIFQSHGHHDEILPFHIAEQCRDLFKSHQHHVHFHPFDGGHEIPAHILEKSKVWLKTFQK